ncbi:MAG: autotransporter outer membrane beta-barrel domain-containing protein [Legionella sp.]|nr:MAG: autotransporter outer membrane beta-barrel domain-containing protein [Legionella sp.]
MKIQSIMMGICLIGNGQMVMAAPVTQNQPTQPSHEMCSVIPKGIFSYGYTDFNFDSTEGLNYLKFQGHSNLFSVGADNIELMPTLYAGVSLFQVNTSMDWQMAVIPGDDSSNSQNIQNNSIFGHVLKQFNSNFFVDVAGAYGRNRISSNVITINTPAPEFGSAIYHNDNWLAGVNGIYRQTYNQFDATASIGYLYSQINSPSYNFTVLSPATVLPVEPLTNEVSMITENLEIGDHIRPATRVFINGGLFQVVEFSNSRPVLFTPTVGVLPQLFVDQSGFRLGAGVGVNFHDLNFRLEEKYYNAGNVFTSWQTLATVQWMLD